MQRIFLGILAGTDVPTGVIKAVAALFDFNYTAQYQSHNTESLNELSAALLNWHTHKAAFIKAGTRTHIRIPKFHMLEHYVSSIKEFGTTDNYSTELFERLHIDLVKNAWAASNRRDAFPQMAKWLDRRERVLQFTLYLKWRQGLQHQERISEPRGECFRSYCGAPMCIAKCPPMPRQLLSNIQELHGVPGFGLDMYNFIVEHCSPGMEQRLIMDPSMMNSLVSERLDVWHQVKLTHPDFQGLDDDAQTKDTIFSKAGRFDIALVQTAFGPGDVETSSLRDARVAQVRVIFRLPERLRRIDPGLPSEPLAYVFWWKAPDNNPDPASGMYIIRKASKGLWRPSAGIIRLANIRHSLHLIPKFNANSPVSGAKQGAHARWTSADVLEQCSTFFINNFVSHDIYFRVF
jgi:hypothetical protein